MLEALTEGCTYVITSVGFFATQIFDATNGNLRVLMPAIGLALGYGAVKFGIHVVKSIVPNI